MQQFPKGLRILAFAGALIVCIVAAIMYQVNYHSVKTGMKQSSVIALGQSIDLSVRAAPGEMAINKTKFEKIFKEQFQKNNPKVTIRSYSFEYLNDSNGFLKAVKIKLVDGHGMTHQLDYVPNIRT